MNNRTMVKAERTENYIFFRTISRTRKSPSSMGISPKQLLRLKQENCVIANDGNRFALLGHNEGSDQVVIVFYWMHMDGDGETLTGRRQTVKLPYEALMAFAAREWNADGDNTWKALSQDQIRTPHLVFDSYKNLKAVIAIPLLRHRLFKFLSKQFQWPESSEIRFHDDFTPYSFVFDETRRAGGYGMFGGVILHNQEDLRKSSYSVHT